MSQPTVDLDHFVPSGEQRNAQRRRLERESTRVTRWRERDDTGFNIATVVPNDGFFIGSCVVPMSHDYRIDSFLLRRLEILADVTCHRVLAVETPGITMRADNPAQTQRTRVPARTLFEMIKGDYSAVAALQIAALNELVAEDVARCRIVGESLGAQLGASLASAVGGARSIDLIEPVNCRPLRLGGMFALQRALVGTETLRKADYVERNLERGWGDYLPFEQTTSENARVDRRLKALHRQGRFVLAAAFGLRHSLDSALQSLPRGTLVRGWVGSGSEVSRVPDARWLADRLRHAGIRLTVTSMSAANAWPHGIGHHALSDFDLMFAFSQVLNTRWQNERNECA